MLNRLTRWLQAPPEAKASRAQGAIALYVAGRAVWTPRDYAALAREGFQKNAIVHRAVRLVARGGGVAAARAQGRRPGARPSIRCSRCSRRPNAREGGQRFLESLYGHLMVSGNAYVEAVERRRRAARAPCAAARPHARGARRRRLARGL